MYHYSYGGSHKKSSGLLGQAVQTADRVLVFLTDITASSISHVGRTRQHCCASPFQEQAVRLSVVVYIFFLFPVVMTAVAEHHCDG